MANNPNNKNEIVQGTMQLNLSPVKDFVGTLDCALGSSANSSKPKTMSLSSFAIFL